MTAHEQKMHLLFETLMVSGGGISTLMVLAETPESQRQKLRAEIVELQRLHPTPGELQCFTEILQCLDMIHTFDLKPTHPHHIIV